MPTSIEQFIEERHELKLDRPAGKHLTDMRAAEEFVKEFGRIFRHCQAIGDLVWDKNRWRKDETAEFAKLVKRTVRGLYDKAERYSDLEELQKAWRSWVVGYESNAKLKAIMAIASTEPGIQIRVDQLDADPFLLNTLTGTIDLRTGELYPHNRSDYLTKLCPVEYDPAATCSLWTAYLKRTFADNDKMIAFCQRAVGDALLGIIRNHVLHVLWGDGDNGKSVFIETMCGMLGDYASIAPPKILLAKKHDEHPTEIADLRGRRFIGTVEIEKGSRLDEAKVKQLTGGDTLKGRYMKKDFFEFKPSHSIFMAANHKPEIRGTDHGIWRRIKLWPFTVQIPKAEQNPRLKEDLEAEYPGILAWAVQGCIESQANGLDEPDDVKMATQKYRTESDQLTEFVNKRCTTQKSTTGLPPRVGAAQLYDAFKEWFGDDVMSQTEFGKAITDKGIIKYRDSATRRVMYEGIGLVE